MDKNILIRTLIRNKANNQISINLPKKDLVGLVKKNNTTEPKRVKIKIKGFEW